MFPVARAIAADSGAKPISPSDRGRWLTLLLAIIATFGAGGIGGALTAGSVGTWYQTIARPTWTPPDSVFGPVWSTLYLMMALAVWRAWDRSAGAVRRTVVVVFGVQLLLNVLWSALFFGLRSPGLGVVGILLLWVAIVATIRVFWGSSRVASLLLVPYLGWSSFAAVLNGTIWQLNLE